MSGERDIPQMLAEARTGDSDALGALMPLVYDELRRLADRYLRHERPGHTLQPTALVHEAYLRLAGDSAGSGPAERGNRAYFFAAASQAMRRILVDHAKGRGRKKRGGERVREVLAESSAVLDEKDLDLVALDEALTRLAELDPRKGKVVELRYFGGLSLEEVADSLGTSVATVKRDWTLAKTWLLRELIR